jgi:hypothetical protein
VFPSDPNIDAGEIPPLFEDSRIHHDFDGL